MADVDQSRSHHCSRPPSRGAVIGAQARPSRTKFSSRARHLLRWVVAQARSCSSTVAHPVATVRRSSSFSCCRRNSRRGGLLAAARPRCSLVGRCCRWWAVRSPPRRARCPVTRRGSREARRGQKRPARRRATRSRPTDRPVVEVYPHPPGRASSDPAPPPRYDRTCTDQTLISATPSVL